MKKSQTAWERWELAALDDGKAPVPPPMGKELPPEVKLPTVEEVEQIRREAHEAGQREGYEAGHAEGYAKGEEEALKIGREAAEQLLDTAVKLDQALDALDEAVAAELSGLAIEIARQVLCQTLNLQPESIVPVVREALAQLPLQHAAIHLHPEEAALVRRYAGDSLTHAGHRIIEDARVARGDVLIEAGGAQVDGTVASRWHRTLASLGFNDQWQPEQSGRKAAEPKKPAEKTDKAP